MTFSERYGFKPIKAIQVDSMDDALRNSLWNKLLMYYFDTFGAALNRKMSQSQYVYHVFEFLSLNIATEFLYERSDIYLKYISNYPNSNWSGDATRDFVAKFYFEMEWFQVYNLIEFILENDSTVHLCGVDEGINEVLDKHNSAYRLINYKFTPITSDYEIKEIRKVLKTTKLSSNLKWHLEKSLGHLSNKTHPDYHNSIKEAICAVEAVCKRIASNDGKSKNNASLGQALNTIEKMENISMNGRLKEAFNQLYAYTNDGNGVRHAKSNKSYASVELEEAKYMLVSCSAFINYLIIKADKAGIDLVD